MNKIRIICCALLLILVSQALHADENRTPTRKSPEDATMRSLVSTFGPILLSMPFLQGDNEAVGIGLLSTGVLLGPGLGHLYAKNSDGFRKGLVVRAIGGGMVVSGLSSLSFFDDDNSNSGLLIVSGSLIVLYSMIRDITSSGDAARRYNDSLGLSQVVVVPTYNPQTKGIGMNLSFSF